MNVEHHWGTMQLRKKPLILLNLPMREPRSPIVRMRAPWGGHPGGKKPLIKWCSPNLGGGTPGFSTDRCMKKGPEGPLLFNQLNYVMRESSIITISTFHTFTLTTVDSFIVLVFGNSKGDDPIVIFLEGGDKCIVELVIHKWT